MDCQLFSMMYVNAAHLWYILVFGLVKGRAKTEGSVLAGTLFLGVKQNWIFTKKQVINKVLVWFLNLKEKVFYQE